MALDTNCRILVILRSTKNNSEMWVGMLEKNLDGIMDESNAVQQVGCSFQISIFEELNSLRVRHMPSKLAEFLKEIQTKDRETVAKLQILEREMELNAISCSYGCTVLAMGEFGYGLQINHLTEQADSTRLQDKMKFWFTRARTEDEGLARVLRDLSFEIRITMHKGQRLLAELEALGERRDVVTALKAMREIVARDSAKLAVLEQLLVGTHVAIHLKEGYLADME
ncbi:hypothetical protein Tco_0615526 [Tanacetum coccineum]